MNDKKANGVVRRQEVRTFEERFVCSCGTELQSAMVLDSYPPIYCYKCPACGAEDSSRHRYPRVVTEPVQS